MQMLYFLVKIKAISSLLSPANQNFAVFQIKKIFFFFFLHFIESSYFLLAHFIHYCLNSYLHELFEVHLFIEAKNIRGGRTTNSSKLSYINNSVIIIFLLTSLFSKKPLIFIPNREIYVQSYSDL